MSTIDATREPAESGRVASEKIGTSQDRAAAGMDTAGTTGRRGLRYIPGLDGIRAIAVLAVLLYHADVPWMPGGFLGVDIFFVLSGFLITSIVLTELDGTGRLDFKRFYIHRARRLLPAMFVVLALAAVLAAFLATDAAATVRRDILGALTYTTNWVYIFTDQSYFEATGRPPMLQHLWSLAVEEQFYLIWPAVAVLAWRRGGRTRVRNWALIGAFGSTALMLVISLMSGFPQPNDGSRVYFGTDTHAMGLLIGAALATIWMPDRLKTNLAGGAKTILNVAGFGGLALLVLIMMNTHSNASWLYWGGFLIFSGIAAIVIAAASHPASILGTVLGTQPLKYIGQRSYGLYLFHWPVFVVLRPELDVPLEGFANLVLRFAITFGLAELSYRYIEMPIRRGQVRTAWRKFKSLSAAEQEPIRRRFMIIGAVTMLVAALTTVRLVTIEEETPDYLGGMTEISALDAAVESEKVDEVKPGDPTLSDTVTAPTSETEFKRGVLAVGESVMLGAQGGLRSSFKKLSIDAGVGRQAADMVARLKQLEEAGAFRETVILHTGSNGYVTEQQLRSMLKVLSDVPRVVVVNVDVPREWKNPNNELIEELVAETPNTVLADWHARTEVESGLHVKDGVHLTQKGVREYSDVLKQATVALTEAQEQLAEPTNPVEQPES